MFFCLHFIQVQFNSYMVTCLLKPGISNNLASPLKTYRNKHVHAAQSWEQPLVLAYVNLILLMGQFSHCCTLRTKTGNTRHAKNIFLASLDVQTESITNLILDLFTQNKLYIDLFISWTLTDGVTRTWLLFLCKFKHAFEQIPPPPFALDIELMLSQTAYT